MQEESKEQFLRILYHEKGTKKAGAEMCQAQDHMG